jgi:hypothetical protein
MLFGADADADFDVDSLDGASDGMGLFSIRSMASFLTFFGLVGMWGHSRGWSDEMSALVGVGCGAAMMLVVAWIMSLQSKLHSEGNIDPANAVGKTATVYLRIPAEHQGRGKITVSIQDRTHEYQAITKGPELPTGCEVRVARMVTENTFEVEAIE